MSDQEIRAKIFISCGQRKNTEEFGLAQSIESKLLELGFETYVATEKQTLNGVKESIFPELENSEYFLFIDFKREKLDDGKFCRGSLFSHQELAVASYLEIFNILVNSAVIGQEVDLIPVDEFQSVEDGFITPRPPACWGCEVDDRYRMITHLRSACIGLIRPHLFGLRSVVLKLLIRRTLEELLQLHMCWEQTATSVSPSPSRRLAPPR